VLLQSLEMDSPQCLPSQFPTALLILAWHSHSLLISQVYVFSLKTEFVLLNWGFTSQDYKPVTHHWFHKRQLEKHISWHPFSAIDNDALEKAYQSGNFAFFIIVSSLLSFVKITGNKDTIVATDGGRYDVNVFERKRVPIFWDQPPNEVRRCSWFYKNPQESLSFPYEELFSTKLEVFYVSKILPFYLMKILGGIHDCLLKQQMATPG
jgi:hypothetical protein